MIKEESAAGTVRWLNLRLLSFSVFIALIAGGGVFMLADREWEAVAEIDIGQVVGVAGASNEQSSISQPVPIEAPTVTIERIASPAFVKTILKKAGADEKLTSDYLPKKFGGKGKLDVRQAFGTNLLIVRVRAHDKEQALKLAEACAQETISDHAKEAARFLAGLESLRASLDAAPNRATAYLERAYLTVMQAAPFSRETRLLVPVELLDVPVFPTRLFCVLFGAFVGVALYCAMLALNLLRRCRGR